MTDDIHSRLTKTLDTIKQAGAEQVGETLKPTSYGGSVKSRAQVQWEYKAKQTWLARHRRDYQGW